MMYPSLKSLFPTAALLLLPSAAAAFEPFFTRFDTFSQKEWYIGDFAQKDPAFTTAWDPTNVVVTPEGQLQLSIEPAPVGSGKKFNGAEVQLREKVHFGYYEVVMTPAKGHGLISAFFTYTGPWFEDPHDEIDWEFLGQNTRKVWVTRFADGERLPGKWADIDYDYHLEPRLYAFDWTEDHIIWYIDGEEIFRVEAKDRTLPVTPGKIYLSIWGGGEKQEAWSGIAPDDIRATVTYDCISYVPVGMTGQQCSDFEEFNYGDK